MTEPPTLVGRSITWPGAPKPHATLKRMRFMTLSEYQNARLVEVAGNIADEVDGKDNAEMARAILTWMRDHTRFVPDPIGQQLLKSPLYLLEVITAQGKVAGDCVDVAMLGAALAMAVGLHACFVAESYGTPSLPGSPCLADSPLVHVYTTVQTQHGWVMLDTQQPPVGPDRTPCHRVELPLL